MTKCAHDCSSDKSSDLLQPLAESLADSQAPLLYVVGTIMAAAMVLVSRDPPSNIQAPSEGARWRRLLFILTRTVVGTAYGWLGYLAAIVAISLAFAVIEEIPFGIRIVIIVAYFLLVLASMSAISISMIERRRQSKEAAVTIRLRESMGETIMLATTVFLSWWAFIVIEAVLDHQSGMLALYTLLLPVLLMTNLFTAVASMLQSRTQTRSISREGRAGL